MKSFLAAALGLSLAIATAFAADAPLKGFAKDGNDDLFGYYGTATPVKVGKMELDHMHLGMKDDFTKYIKGTERLPTYAPFMFQFTDLGSKMVKNEENGQMYHANQPRVLPTAFRIQGNMIAFAGTAKEVGAVSFTGTIDRKKIAGFNGGRDSQGEIVIKGDLTVAGKVFKNIGFSWSGGD